VIAISRGEFVEQAENFDPFYSPDSKSKIGKAGL
jgi:hypothetical protein